MQAIIILKTLILTIIIIITILTKMFVKFITRKYSPVAVTLANGLIA